MVRDSEVELVFKALSRKRGTVTLYLVWFSLLLHARQGVPRLDLAAVADSLGLNHQTVRRCIRVLTKLGILAPYRPELNRCTETIYLRAGLDQEVTDVLTSLAAGQVTINVATTSIRDRRSGRFVDNTAAMKILIEDASASDGSGKRMGMPKGIVFLETIPTRAEARQDLDVPVSVGSTKEGGS